MTSWGMITATHPTVGIANSLPAIHRCSRSHAPPLRVIPEAEGYPGPIGQLIVAHGPVLVAPSK